jgi:hypothetical protein
MHASLLRTHLTARVLSCMQDQQSPLYQAECVKALAPKAAADPRAAGKPGKGGKPKPGNKPGRPLPAGHLPPHKKARLTGGGMSPLEPPEPDDDGDGSDNGSSAPPSEGQGLDNE